MENNLFQQAKDMMDDWMNNRNEQGGQKHQAEDKEAIRNAIQAAYNEATPEEEQQLRQLEQHLDDHIDLH